MSRKEASEISEASFLYIDTFQIQFIHKKLDFGCHLKTQQS